jgi:hypothetical protein
VHPHIGNVVEPCPALLVEIRSIGKRPPVDEIVTEIAHGSLDFALGQSRQLQSMRVVRGESSASPIRFTH